MKFRAFPKKIKNIWETYEISRNYVTKNEITIDSQV